MSLTDALVVTALGMGVVFIGLTLTALLISTFGLAARFKERRTNDRPSPISAAMPVTAGPVDEKVLAVIAAVLEVERRLHRAESTGRLTIVRTEVPWRSR